jgi:AraC-like DNA-binding protein
MQNPEIEIRLVRRRLYQDDRHWNFPVNLYPFNTFYFILGGDGHVKTGDTVTALLPGYVYLIPANTLFSCWCDHSIYKLYVEAYAEYFPGFDVFSGIHTVKARKISSSFIRKLIRKNTDNPADLLCFRGMIAEIISGFIDHSYEPPSPQAYLFQPVLLKIQNEFSPQLNIEELASSCGISSSTLYHKFKKIYGCSLKQYIVHMLMCHLREELITSDLTLLQLAEKYHFCDPYYLSAFFKKHAGVYPAAYRSTREQFLISYPPSESGGFA